jgi:hypothetical protein
MTGDSSCLLYSSCLQFFLIMKPIESMIKNDIANEERPSWETRDERRDVYAWREKRNVGGRRRR